MSGFVYAIRSGCGLVKIGWSSDPQKRFGKVQSDAPQPCVLVGAIPETREYEAALHAKFSAFRERGEWFREEGEVAAFVSRLPEFPRPSKMMKWSKNLKRPNKLADYMAEHGLTDEAVAQRIGRERSFVTRLRQGKASPSLRTLSDISAATGGAVTAEDFFPAPQPAQAEGSAA